MHIMLGHELGYVAQIGMNWEGPDQQGGSDSPPAGYNGMCESGLDMLANPSLELCIQHLCKV